MVKGDFINNKSLSTTDLQSISNIRRARKLFPWKLTYSPHEQDADRTSYSGTSSSSRASSPDGSIIRSPPSSPHEQDADSISCSGASSSSISSSISSSRSSSPDGLLTRSHSSSNFRDSIHHQIVKNFSVESSTPPGQKFERIRHKGEFFAVTDQKIQSLMTVYGQSVFSGLESNAKILDVGCGPGSYVEFLRYSMGYKAYGIDIISRNSLSQISNSPYIMYGAAIEDTPLTKEYFNVILSSRSLFTNGGVKPRRSGRGYKPRTEVP